MRQGRIIKFLLEARSRPRNEQIDLVSYAARRLDETYFKGPPRLLWTILHRFFLRTTVIPDREQFLRVMEQKRPTEEQRAVVEAFLDELEQAELVEEQEFRVEVNLLQERVLDSRFNDLVMDTNEIFHQGKVIGKDRVVGRENAIRHFIMQAPRLAMDGHMNMLDVTQEGEAVLEEHNAATEGQTSSVLSFIQEIDNIQFGMQPGEMGLIAGYTGEGKSMYCVNVAHSAVCRQGLNVLYLTTETPPPVVRRRFVVCHSNDGGRFPNGPLSYRATKHGRLNRDGAELLRSVSRDLATNEQYGKLFVNYLPATVTEVETVLMELNAAWPLSLLIIDYLALMYSPRAGRGTMEQLREVLKEVKRMAVSFDNRGLAVLSPWQMSRDAWKSAQNVGYYGKASLAETSEAEKSSDSILAILRTESGLTCNFLKLRDEDVGMPFALQCEFNNILIRSAGEGVRARFG